jgi:hypothetical protein
MFIHTFLILRRKNVGDFFVLVSGNHHSRAHQAKFYAPLSVFGSQYFKHELNICIQVHVFSNNYTIYEPYNDLFLSLDIYK